MTKSNQLVKSLKNINKSINSLLERNLNKLKFDNLKIIVTSNKIVLTFVALFVLFISYLLTPTFYNQTDISKELKNELLDKFNLNLNLSQKLKYNFLPSPHFVTKESFIIKDKKKISEIKELKIYVSLKNLFSVNNINIKEIILNNANFELDNKNNNFFIKLLDNNFFDTNLEIKNSNVFFRNTQNEILFINKIDKLKYYFNDNELKNVLYSENEIFNIPYSIEIINHQDEKKLYTKLNISSAKLQIENVYSYEKKIKLGSANLKFNKRKSSVIYKINQNFFEFNYFDDSEKKKFFYSGKFNLKPFYSTFEGAAEEINISYLFGKNAIIAELLRTGVLNSKNIDFKLKIDANKIQSKRNFINLILKSKIQDGIIDIDDTQIEWKNNSIIKLNDTLIFVKDGKLFLDGRSQINIKNVKNIYKFLLTPKNFRKKIKKIDFRFSYAFDEKVVILNDIVIDGKYNKKVNEKLNNIYFRGSDMQNKIFFKNMTNDLLKAYSG